MTASYILALLVICVASHVVAFAPAPAKLWWLNTFLAKQTIGRFETLGFGNISPGVGPCPVEGNACGLSFADLPDSVKAIGVHLPAPLFNSTVTLGSALPSGSLKAWYTELNDVEIASVDISGVPDQLNREKIVVQIDGFKAGARLVLRLLDIPTPVIGSLTVSQVEVYADKSLQTNGTSIYMEFFVQSPTGTTLSNSFPNNVTMGTCSIKLDLKLSIGTPVTNYPFPDKQTVITNYLLGIAEPILGDVVCGIIRQLFTTVDGGDGFIELLVKEAYDAIGNLSYNAQPTLEGFESSLTSTLTADQRANAVNFGTSTVVKGASVVLNNWLDAGGPSNPAVNEVLGLLTAPNNGTATFTNLESWGLSLPIHTPVAEVVVDVSTLTLSGLTTFGNIYGLQVLKNDNTNPPLNYTLDNKISFGTIGVNLIANITLLTNLSTATPYGGWIYPRPPLGIAKTFFTLNYTVALKHLDVELALSLVTDPSKLKSIQLGQLLGKQDPTMNVVQQLVMGGQCASPSMYQAGIPSFILGLEDIVTPVFSMTPADDGIIQLVNHATDVGLSILKDATTNQIGLVSQFWLRPLVNSIVSNFFISGGGSTDCPEYLSLGKNSLDLQNSVIFSSAKSLIKNAIGGDPVRDTAASINALVTQVILFLCEAFASSSTCSLTGPGKWSFTPSLTLYPGRSFPKSSPFDSSIALTDIKMTGVNSIFTLLLDNIPNTPQGINLILQLGQAGNPLTIDIFNHWSVNYPAGGNLDVDELFDLKVSLIGFKLNISIIPDFDLDQFYQLTVGDLTNSACLLAPFAALNLNLDLSATNLSVVMTNSSGPFSTPGNALRSAIGQVIIDQASGYPNLNTMFNFVLGSIGRFTSSKLTGITNSVVDATNCADQTNNFDTFLFRVIFAALQANLTDVFEKVVGPQDPIPLPTDLDNTIFTPLGSAPYDLSQSVVIPLLGGFISGASQDNFLEVMRTLGNNTGDILSDSFVLEPDNSVTLDLNFMDISFFASGFDLSFLITDAVFYLNSIRLTNVTNLDMSSLEVFKPLSKFVLGTHVKVPGKMSFALSFSLKLPQSLKGLTGPDVMTTFNLTMDLVDLEVALQALIALDGNKVNGLSLGNFLSVDSDQTFTLNPNAITCLLRLFFPNGLSLPQLLIGLTSIGTPTITASNYEFVSKGTIMMLQAMLRIFGDFYVQDLADLTQNGLRVLLNNFLLEPNIERPGVCLNPTPPALNGTHRIWNFKQSTSVGLINTVTKTLLAGDDGKYSLFNAVLNAAVNPHIFLKSPDYDLSFSNLNVTYKKAVFATLSGALRDIQLTNLGSFAQMDLFEATSNTSIANKLRLLGPVQTVIGLSWTMANLFDGNEAPVTDDVKLTLGLKNFTIGFTVHMDVDIPELLTIQTGSFTNFSQIACVFTAIQNFSISDFTLDVAQVTTKLECDGICQSPLFKGMAEGIPISSGDDNTIANKIPDVIALVVSILNDQLFSSTTGTLTTNAQRSCNSALNLTLVYAVLNSSPENGLNVSVIFALGLLGIGGALFVLTPLAIPRHYQLKDKMLAENLLAANKEPGANAQSVARYMAKMEREQIALAYHPAVSTCCKCFIPVMSIVNVIMLGLSFLAFLAFSMQGRLFLLGSVTNTYTLVPWTVSKTINDMWNSGAWPLSILIVFASCAWPVLKNIALFGIWFAPKTFLSHRMRMWVLVQLDVLGKWSFLDVYIINILVGALKFTLVLADSKLGDFITIPDSLFVIDVVLSPGAGIILLSIAAFMSLIVNHVIIWELLKAEWADRRLFKQIDGLADDMLTPKASIRLSISEYVFSTTTPTGQRDRYGPKAKNAVILLLGSAILFLIVAYFVPYVTFTYDGLIGYTIGFFIAGGRARTFSLFSIGTALPAASTGTTLQNCIFLFFTVLYFATVVVAPVLQMSLHLFLWLKPLSLKDAHTVYFFSKVAAYWASMEVFCLGIVATTIEIRPVTLFLIDFITSGACSVLKAPLTLKFEEQNGACLNPAATVAWGFPIAFAANMFQILCGAIMIRASGVAIRDREDVLERRAHQQWTYLEYLVLDRFLVHGAAHHKPLPDPTRSKPCLQRLVEDCSSNPVTACTGCGAALFSKINICSGCCAGVQDVSLTAPIAKNGKVTNSKWNAPPSQASAAASKWNATPSQASAQSSKWNSPQNYGAPSSPNQSWNMSPSPQNSQGMVINTSVNLDSPNPVFAREQQKRYSIDV